MRNNISNEEFEKALNNHDNKKIIAVVCNRFTSSLSYDILYTCGLYGLWKALQNHDPQYNRKFTTTLYKFVSWECMRELYIKQNTSHNLGLLYDMEDDNRGQNIEQYINLLPDLSQQQLLYDKYKSKMTFTEIGKKHSYTKQAAKAAVKKALSNLKTILSKNDYDVY
jgi:DNA-directed RNA polymerase specialized sigma subunit